MDTARNAVWTCGFADIDALERSGDIRYRYEEWMSLFILGSALCVGGATDLSYREVEVFVAGCLRSL